MVAYTCNSGIQEVETRGSEIQGNPQLYGESESRLGYLGPSSTKELGRWLSGKGACCASEDLGPYLKTDVKVGTTVMVAACNLSTQEAET